MVRISRKRCKVPELIPAAEMVQGKTVNNVDFGNASKAQKIATGVAGGIFSLIALISFLGCVSLANPSFLVLIVTF